MQQRIRQLELFLTHRCNLRCTYCFATHGTPPPDLTPVLADAAVDFLFAAGQHQPRLQLELWGGEPFLRPDLLERIATRARSRASATGQELLILIPTNVTLLGPAALELVARLQLQLSLSLDGGPDAHANRRNADGASAWPQIEAALARLQADPPGGQLPPVRMTVTPERAGRAAEDWDWLVERGFRQVSLLPRSGGGWTAATTAMLDEALAEIADRLARQWRAAAATPLALPLLHPRLARRRLVQRTGLPCPHTMGTCGAGVSLVCADTLGQLFPCHRLVARPPAPLALQLGHVTTGLAPSALATQLADFSMDTPGIRCATCPRRDGCVAICLAQNHRFHGSLFQVAEENCWLNERLDQAAARLLEGLAGDGPALTRLDTMLAQDPDWKWLPLLSRLEHAPEALLDRAWALLDHQLTEGS